MRVILVTLFALGLVACRHPRTPVAPVRLFGPVIGNEIIAGRADDGGRNPVVLLVAERSLVSIDVQHRTSTRTDLALADASSCWGLARLSDGSLWTIRDWKMLRQISASGDTVREFALDGAHAALFSAGDRLLFQRAEFVAPEQALTSGKPGDSRREPWSTLQTRPYKLARTSVAALNLVTCGPTRAEERACWFPDDPGVALIDVGGRTRRMELSGIPHVAPEVLLTSDNPARPVRDAFVDRTGSLWIVSAGTPIDDGPHPPGGWLLAHFAPAGTPLERFDLTEPARLILDADSARVVLLLGSGYVAEVRL
ncbi:MAG TPA: hypothetical protein VL484_02960 [Vicinamibacterales bacterium]|jgi:hypothetical protein|nr:hypothetical protein [Vicinamibacterales bacterium]